MEVFWGGLKKVRSYWVIILNIYFLVVFLVFFRSIFTDFRRPSINLELLQKAIGKKINYQYAG